MADYVVQDEAGFIAQVEAMLAKTKPTPTAYGLSAAQATTMDDMLTVAKASIAAEDTKINETRAATAQKNVDVNKLRAEFRNQAGTIKANSTEAQIAEVGLNVPDTTPTAVGVPTTRPIGTVNTSQRLEHRIAFIDETSTTSGSRAKPEGVRGCQIWVKIDGAPPTSIKDCQFIAEDSATPYLSVFEGADAGKTAYYILRWVNTKGEPGPISETIEATVTG